MPYVGDACLAEANATIQVNRRGHGCEHEQGRVRGHGHYNSWNQGDYNQSQNKNNTSNNQKLNRSEKLSGKTIGPHNKKVYETECYKCGMKGHWSRTCRTTKHLVDLYQASMKGKGKHIKTNFIDGKKHYGS